MIIDQTISVGDIFVIGGLIVGGAANYFGTVGKVKSVDYKVEELRRGRGLILKDWPYPVQRCFNYINGNGSGRHHDE